MGCLAISVIVGDHVLSCDSESHYKPMFLSHIMKKELPKRLVPTVAVAGRSQLLAKVCLPLVYIHIFQVIAVEKQNSWGGGLGVGRRGWDMGTGTCFL